MAHIRLPRLDCALSRNDVVTVLNEFGLALPSKIAAAAKEGGDLGGFTVDAKALDAAMATASLSLAERINVKTSLGALGLLKGPRTVLSNSGPFARLS